MTDPRDGRRVALKKLPNVFQSLVSSKRVFRELKMLCYFKHENVSIHDQQSHLHRIVGEVPYLCNGIQKVHSKLTLLVILTNPPRLLIGGSLEVGMLDHEGENLTPLPQYGCSEQAYVEKIVSHQEEPHQSLQRCLGKINVVISR